MINYYFLLVRTIILKLSVDEVAHVLNVPPSYIEDLEGLMTDTSQELFLKYQMFVYEITSVIPEDYINMIVENIIEEFDEYIKFIDKKQWVEISAGRAMIAYDLIDNDFIVTSYSENFSDNLLYCYSGYDPTNLTTIEVLFKLLSKHYTEDDLDIDDFEFEIKKHPIVLSMLATYELKMSSEKIHDSDIDGGVVRWCELRNCRLQYYSVIE